MSVEYLAGLKPRAHTFSNDPALDQRYWAKYTCTPTSDIIISMKYQNVMLQYINTYLKTNGLIRAVPITTVLQK